MKKGDEVYIILPRETIKWSLCLSCGGRGCMRCDGSGTENVTLAEKTILHTKVSDVTPDGILVKGLLTFKSIPFSHVFDDRDLAITARKEL